MRRALPCLSLALLIAWPAPVWSENANVDASDPLPEGAVRRLGTSRFRCEFRLDCIGWSADGSLVLAGSEWGDVQAWDAATGRPVWSTRGFYGN